MKLILTLLGFAFIGCAGCSDHPAPPAPLAAEQIPAAMDSAFAKAAPESRQTADEIVAAWQKQDKERAIVQLQGLCAQPQLTPAQRVAATRTMMAMRQQLQAAAANGDAYAADLLQKMRASK
jgi:hypothetical protein